MANLLRKANRGGQAPVKIQLKAARTEGREFEPQPETLQTLPDPVLYIVIVSYIYALEHPIKKLLKTNWNAGAREREPWSAREKKLFRNAECEGKIEECGHAGRECLTRAPLCRIDNIFIRIKRMDCCSCWIRVGNLLIARFFAKKWANERFAQKTAHSLIFGERPEQFAHSRSFVLSDLTELLTVAHLIWAIWAIWANERWAYERIPNLCSWHSELLSEI